MLKKYLWKLLEKMYTKTEYINKMTLKYQEKSPLQLKEKEDPKR